MMYEELTEICDRAETVQIMTNAVKIGANPFGCTDYLNQKNRILDTGTAVVEWMDGQSLHTKTVLIDDNLCVIGSFNMDMRSVYLDTELMVVIDCPELNRELRPALLVMADQSKSVAPDGSIEMGARCEDKNMPFLKACLYLPPADRSVAYPLFAVNAVHLEDTLNTKRRNWHYETGVVSGTAAQADRRDPASGTAGAFYRLCRRQ